MTPSDKQLDPSILNAASPLTRYRLTSRKYATSLSGLGAAMYPGRWNTPGEEAIYTSTEQGVCVLERLVHTPKDRIPTDLALMTIHLAGNWDRLSSHRSIDRSTQANRLSFNSLAAGRAWLLTNQRPDDTVAFAIPSVVVPVWNVVLYPRARRFWDHVQLVSVEPFDYDPRLFSQRATAKPT